MKKHIFVIQDLCSFETIAYVEAADWNEAESVIPEELLEEVCVENHYSSTQEIRSDNVVYDLPARRDEVTSMVVAHCK